MNDAIQLTNPAEGISVAISGPMPTFRTYPVPLEQVLRNLIGNAVKHHPGPQGSIAVSCEDRGNHYLFSIADDGEGIPAEYAQRVFEMFQTLKPRDSMESTGIGLAIVKKIVTAKGGRAWVDSAVGRGATFSFTWPKQPEPTTPSRL